MPRLASPLTHVAVFAWAMATLWAAGARAAEPVYPTHAAAGLGVGYQPPTGYVAGDPLTTTGFEVTVPFLLHRLRLEPVLGVSASKTEYAGGADSSATTLTGGIGAFGAWPLDRSTLAYAGMRLELGHDWAWATPDGTADVRSQQTTWAVGPGVGAEVFLSSAFSLGAEAGLDYVRIGEPQTHVSGTAAQGLVGEGIVPKRWSAQMRTSILFRVYLWQLD